MTRRPPLAALLLSSAFCLIASPARSTPAHATFDPQAPSARLDPLRPPEVRLRKLHLVRPDLIPYPIEYEVVC